MKTLGSERIAMSHTAIAEPLNERAITSLDVCAEVLNGQGPQNPENHKAPKPHRTIYLTPTQDRTQTLKTLDCQGRTPPPPPKIKKALKNMEG